MIILKKIDVYGQALIFGLGILLLFVDKDKWIGMSLLFSLPMGCWQVLSAFMHFCLKNKSVTLKERKGYIISVVVFLFILINLLSGKLKISCELVAPWFFFIGSTCLAIWYFTISFRELTIWEKRQLIQFK